MRHYITCLPGGLKRCMRKSVNYGKVREVVKEEVKNLAVFLSQVTEAFRKDTHIDPESTEGKTYWPLDIQRKLQKLEAGPQNPLSTLVEDASKVSNN